MTRRDSVGLSQCAAYSVAVLGMLAGGCGQASPDLAQTTLAATGFDPNGFPHKNGGGFAATFSTQGVVNLTGEYFQAQGSNGRSCGSCHVATDAWAITPESIQRMFDETDGLHPIFNPLDANNPNTIDDSTVEGLRAAYSQMLSKGVFRRGGTPRPNSEWEVVAAEDPNGFGNVTRLVHWRRSMPTINFHVGSATVNWDGGNNVGTDQRAGLVNQATRNVTGAQQGSPAPAEVITDIVDFESSLSTTQIIVPGVGRLDQCGAQGNPELLSQQAKASDRWNLFDAWIDLVPGACGDAEDDMRRAQIARGQELFNATNPGGRSCRGCHSSTNNGTSFGNTLFDIRTASAEARTPDLPLFTFRNIATGETRQLSDAGRGQVTGLWSDLGRFKTPTLRALAARAPYFHNGIAATLDDVVDHYEEHLGFVFTDDEQDDLVSFMNAL
jgi:cytochrome c peroxidase